MNILKKTIALIVITSCSMTTVSWAMTLEQWYKDPAAWTQSEFEGAIRYMKLDDFNPDYLLLKWAFYGVFNDWLTTYHTKLVAPSNSLINKDQAVLTQELEKLLAAPRLAAVDVWTLWGDIALLAEKKVDVTDYKRRLVAKVGLKDKREFSSPVVSGGSEVHAGAKDPLMKELNQIKNDLQKATSELGSKTQECSQSKIEIAKLKAENQVLKEAATKNGVKPEAFDQISEQAKRATRVEQLEAELQKEKTAHEQEKARVEAENQALREQLLNSSSSGSQGQPSSAEVFKLQSQLRQLQGEIDDSGEILSKCKQKCSQLELACSVLKTDNSTAWGYLGHVATIVAPVAEQMPKIQYTGGAEKCVQDLMAYLAPIFQQAQQGENDNQEQ